MVGIVATFDALTDFREKLQSLSDNMPQEIAIAASQTGYRGRRILAKAAQRFIKAIPQKRLIKAFYYRKKGTEVTIIGNGKFRIALKNFKPSPYSRGVVLAKQTNDGRPAVIQSAFTSTRTLPKAWKKGARNKAKANAVTKPFKNKPITKFNGHPMQRLGKSRLPIKRVPGVNVNVVLLHNNALENIYVDLRDVFIKQLKRRVRFLDRKRRGELNWQQGKGRAPKTRG